MTFEEAARLVWQVLIAAADQRQVLNYEIISQKLDGKILARALGTPLELIADYCEAKGLPALTVLAVSKAHRRAEYRVSRQPKRRQGAGARLRHPMVRSNATDTGRFRCAVAAREAMIPTSSRGSLEVPEDKATMLLDLLAGWSRFVGQCEEDGRLPPGRFQAEYGPNAPDQEVWRALYTQPYAERLAMLYQRAGELVLVDEDGESTLTAKQFLERYVLPLFGDDDTAQR